MKNIIALFAVMLAFWSATGVAEAKSRKKVSYAETSLVPWLDARGRPSEFKDRLVLAEIYGVDNFDKSAEKNNELLLELKKDDAVKKKSVVKWLDVQGLPSEKSVRAVLAIDHKIVADEKDYGGSIPQNLDLLKKLVEADKAKKGLKPVAEPAPAVEAPAAPAPAPAAPEVIVPAEKAPEKVEPVLPIQGAQVASSEVEKPLVPETKDRAKAVFDDYRKKFEERVNTDPTFLKTSLPRAATTPAPPTPAPSPTTSGPAKAPTPVATPAPHILPEVTLSDDDLRKLEEHRKEDSALEGWVLWGAIGLVVVLVLGFFGLRLISNRRMENGYSPTVSPPPAKEVVATDPQRKAQAIAVRNRSKIKRALANAKDVQLLQGIELTPEDRRFLDENLPKCPHKDLVHEAIS